MRLRRFSIQNARSFLDPQQYYIDPRISIIIGPNGGGKTNLLDAIVVMMRRHLFAAPYIIPAPTEEDPDRWELRNNDHLSHMRIERHSRHPDIDQVIEIDIEITPQDIEYMRAIKQDAPILLDRSRKHIYPNPWKSTASWDISIMSPGTVYTYILRNDNFESPDIDSARQFLQYLRLFEIDNQVRAETGNATLQFPFLYMPTARSSAGFQSTVSLSGYNDYEVKRSNDATTSRNSQSFLQLAVGRLAQKFRLMQEDNNFDARRKFHEDENVRLLSSELMHLGYEWSLRTKNALTNEYDLYLKKQGTEFIASAASSGERELLNYIFAIYALNVKDALIVVDEPELHLHPRWQNSLLSMFDRLSRNTGNQFVLSTHSPSFVTPHSIPSVTRVYSVDQCSKIKKLTFHCFHPPNNCSIS